MPWRWWAYLVGFLASVWVAYAAAWSVTGAWLVSLAGLLLGGGVLAAYGATRIVVDGGRLRAGGATLPLATVAEVHALDAGQAARLRGAGYQPEARYLIRGYLPRAVLVVPVEQPGQPPFWYLATRHPDRLGSALAAGRPGQDGLPLDAGSAGP